MRRLTTDLVSFGKPLPFDVFNKEGRLLVRAGLVCEDEEKYRELLDFGFIEGEEVVVQIPKAADPGKLMHHIGVLIADDTPLMLDMLEKNLRNLGVERSNAVAIICK